MCVCVCVCARARVCVCSMPPSYIWEINPYIMHLWPTIGPNLHEKRNCSYSNLRLYLENFMLVFRPLKNIIRLTYVISQVINLVKLTNLG